MFQIEPMPVQVPPDLILLLQKVETATIGQSCIQGLWTHGCAPSCPKPALLGPP